MSVVRYRDGQTLGLTRMQVVIVNCIGLGMGRDEIARILGSSKQSVRDEISGLCEFYGCSTGGLPERVQAELASRSSENLEAR